MYLLPLDRWIFFENLVLSYSTPGIHNLPFVPILIVWLANHHFLKSAKSKRISVNLNSWVLFDSLSASRKLYWSRLPVGLYLVIFVFLWDFLSTLVKPRDGGRWHSFRPTVQLDGFVNDFQTETGPEKNSCSCVCNEIDTHIIARFFQSNTSN